MRKIVTVTAVSDFEAYDVIRQVAEGVYCLSARTTEAKRVVYGHELNHNH